MDGIHQPSARTGIRLGKAIASAGVFAIFAAGLVAILYLAIKYVLGPILAESAARAFGGFVRMLLS